VKVKVVVMGSTAKVLGALMAEKPSVLAANTALVNSWRLIVLVLLLGSSLVIPWPGN
jgi:hypothetical protein